MFDPKRNQNTDDQSDLNENNDSGIAGGEASTDTGADKSNLDEEIVNNDITNQEDLKEE